MNCCVLLRDIFLLLLYTFTSLLGLLANGLVCRLSFQRRNYSHSYLTITTKLSLSTKKIFLLNLALADGLSALTIPIQFLFCSKYFLETFSLSSYICVVSKSLEILALNTSILIICVIAFDRYRHVQNPLQQYYHRKTSRTILFTWIFSGLFSASSFVSMKTPTYFNSSQKLISCQVLFPITINFFPHDYIPKIRLFSLIFFFYIIPLVIIISSCLLTIRILAHRSIIGVQEFQTFKQSQTRSIRLLIIIILVFTFSHFPINFLYFQDFFLSSPMTNCNDSTMYLLFYWLKISSCCHNPIIYSWFNKEYRTLLHQWCQIIIYCRRQKR